MSDTRRKNVTWVLPGSPNFFWEHASLAVLMDIREELQAINRRLNCSETLEIPRLLREIRRNTTKPRKKRKTP